MARLREEERMCQIFFDMVCKLKSFNQINNPEYFKIYHIPNGQRAGQDTTSRKIAGATDKRMGTLRGIPDYQILWAQSINEMPIMKIGFLEAKTPTGKLTKEQKEFKKWCETAHIDFAIFRSADQGLDILKEWGIIKE